MGNSMQSNAWWFAPVIRQMLAIATLASLAGYAQTGSAQQASGMLANTVYGKKHMFAIGGAEQKAEATIRASVDGGGTAGISLDDLAVDDVDSTFFFQYRYQFKPKWAVTAGTYSFSASGGRTVERQFEYDGVEFETGTDIRATIDVDAYVLDVVYKTYATERFSLWLGGGIHALDLGANIRGEVRLNENEAGFQAANESLLAPVPNLRGVASWAITDKLGLRLTAGWLSANVDDYSGDFTYAHLRAFYAIGENIGISLGYQRTDIDITQDRERGELAFDVTLDGPTLTLNFGF